MMSDVQRNKAGWWMYPGGGWRKLMFKMPLYGWRLGLGPLLHRNFLVLTTWGRKSGLPRHTVLEYTVVDGTFYVASGWGARSQWYRNILANPYVTIQARAGTQSMIARRVTDVATLERWYYHAQRSPMLEPYLRSAGIEPTRDDFIAKRDRLQILTFEPTTRPTPPPLKVDLWWVWLLVGAALLAGMRGRLVPDR